MRSKHPLISPPVSIGAIFAQPSVQDINCIRRTSEFSESIRVGTCRCLRNGFQRRQTESLHGLVLYGRNPDRSHLSVLLRYVDPFQWKGQHTLSVSKNTLHLSSWHRIPYYYIVSPCRTFSFIGCHFPYRQYLGFQGSDRKMLQGFHLAVASFCHFAILTYSFLTLRPYRAKLPPSIRGCVRLKMHTRLTPHSFVVSSYFTFHKEFFTCTPFGRSCNWLIHPLLADGRDTDLPSFAQVTDDRL